MPAKSKAQLRLMYAVKEGKAKLNTPGLSKKEASEFIEATSKPSKLPERTKKKKS